MLYTSGTSFNNYLEKYFHNLKEDKVKANFIFNKPLIDIEDSRMTGYTKYHKNMCNLYENYFTVYHRLDYWNGPYLYENFIEHNHNALNEGLILSYSYDNFYKFFQQYTHISDAEFFIYDKPYRAYNNEKFDTNYIQVSISNEEYENHKEDIKRYETLSGYFSSQTIDDPIHIKKEMY